MLNCKRYVKKTKEVQTYELPFKIKKDLLFSSLPDFRINLFVVFLASFYFSAKFR